MAKKQEARVVSTRRYWEKEQRETRVVSLTFAPKMWRVIDGIAKASNATVENIVLAMLALGFSDIVAIGERDNRPKGVPLAEAKRQLAKARKRRG